MDETGATVNQEEAEFSIPFQDDQGKDSNTGEKWYGLSWHTSNAMYLLCICIGHSGLLALLCTGTGLLTPPLFTVGGFPIFQKQKKNLNQK